MEILVLRDEIWGWKIEEWKINIIIICDADSFKDQEKTSYIEILIKDLHKSEVMEYKS